MDHQAQMPRNAFRVVLLMFCLLTAGGVTAQPVLPGTGPLQAEGDLAAVMVEGIREYLGVATRKAAEQRRSIEPDRAKLRTILGLVDERLRVRELELVSTTGNSARIARGAGYDVLAVRWEALPGMFGEGLLLEPHGAPVARVVTIPDAAWSPEMLVGLAGGIPPDAQFARRLAENGAQVVVPTLIDRTSRWTDLEGVRQTNIPHREFLYRMSYELGRHVIGYELQKILAVVDFFEAQGSDAPIAVMGYGEGGLLALHAAAVDERIDRAAVSGYFSDRSELWQEPIDRNVWGLLLEFGDAELASLVAPRRLIVEDSKGPEGPAAPKAVAPVMDFAASGRLVSPAPDAVRTEANRARAHRPGDWLQLVERGSGIGSNATLAALLGVESPQSSGGAPHATAPLPDADARLRRQFDQIVRFNETLVRDSPQRRAEFWAKADNSSVEAWQASTRFHRDYVWDEVIGRLPAPDRPARPKTRRIYDTADFQGYEVTLDVWDGVFAFGSLLVPKDLKPGERRPVVVVQHGLEGRPSDLVDPDVDHRAYHRYGAKLAEEGFIVYAPQNPYIGEDRFRQILRKANPLKLSLFSFVLGQHQQTLDWLKTLPFVDPARIGFYGLSYGGKTAVRVPPFLDDYALSICSGDFNEWVWKTTSVVDRYSYMFTKEYDMLEFNLANVVNYAELATLMAPRPFMVERGHTDGVAPDEWVAYEFARVRRRYDELGLGDRAEIEFFDGPHEIHGVGTFEFLRRHLDWNR